MPQKSKNFFELYSKAWKPEDYPVDGSAQENTHSHEEQKTEEQPK